MTMIEHHCRASSLTMTEPYLVGACVGIIALGLVMVGSASLDTAQRLYGWPLHFLVRQVLHLLIGMGLGWMCMRMRCGCGLTMV